MIVCPKCGSEMSVRETRSHFNCLRRRRYCDNLKCGHRVWTIETISESLPKSDVLVLPADDLRTAIHGLRIALGDEPPDPDDD